MSILLADDDRYICERLAAILVDRGYQVVTAHNGADALVRMRSVPPSLLLLDMVMPVLDGWKVLEEKEKDHVLRQIPVVIVTALGVASAEWAANLGAVALIKKPIDIEHLLKTIEDALE